MLNYSLKMIICSSWQSEIFSERALGTNVNQLQVDPVIYMIFFNKGLGYNTNLLIIFPRI